jgi:transposase InsO family protein
MWLGVTAHPTAEWIARQITEACGWEAVPTYLVRDRDRVYAEAFTRRIRAMGIRDRPTAPRSPWQNGYAERLIGSIKRKCLDHVIINWRATPAPYPAFVPAILQRHPNAPVIGQGLTANETRPGGRSHSSAAGPRRIAPSLRPNLIFARHNGEFFRMTSNQPRNGPVHN